MNSPGADTSSREKANNGGWWVGLLESARRNPKRTDVTITILLAVSAALSNAVSWAALEESDRQSVKWWSVPLLLFAVVPLLWRRTHAELSMFLTTALIVASALGRVPDGFVLVIAIWVAIYSAGAYGGERRSMARTLVVFATFILVIVISYLEEPNIGFAVLAVTLLVNLFYAGSAWLFGETMRFRRSQTEDLRTRSAELELRTSELELRTAELEVERESNAKRAVVEERVRIARELHDVVAHHISLMGVQASAARHVLSKDPEKAVASLAHIETSSREAVEEMQRLLGFLRNEGTVDSIDPQPSLDRVHELIERGQQSGLTITSHIEPTHALPPSVELSAYRIVQEALTNVRKHAGPTRVTVTITKAKDHLLLSIVNDKPTGPLPASLDPDRRALGHGITGMRERVRLVGGTLHTGPTVSGGWEVQAELPLRTGATR
jgi:signal transduction histidine kinase